MTVRVLADLRSPVLLIDSRSLRVTVTCPVEGRYPFLRTYGANLPNSLTSIVPVRPWLSPPAHLCRISVRTPHSPFHGPQAHLTCAVPPFDRFLPLRRPRALTVRLGESPAQADPRRRLSLYGGTGILTRFPFVAVELRRDLGPANPRLIDIAEEPLRVRPSGFQPDYRCYYDQDLRHHSVHTNSRPCFRPSGAPTYTVALSGARPGLGGGFEPRSFWAPQTSAGKLLRFS